MYLHKTNIQDSSCGLWNRDWSDTATRQGMPAATRSFKKQGKCSFLESPEGVWFCWIAVFWPPERQDKRLNFCCVKAPSLWQYVKQPQETNSVFGLFILQHPFFCSTCSDVSPEHKLWDVPFIASPLLKKKTQVCRQWSFRPLCTILGTNALGMPTESQALFWVQGTLSLT